MQTASGQTARGSSNRNAGKPSEGATGRRGLNPMVVGLTALLLVLSLVVMGVYLLGWWPPKPAEASKTIAQQWYDSRTATPGTQAANGLKVEKVGAVVHESDTVTVTLKVTNNVLVPGPDKGTPTPQPGQPAAAPISATVLTGSIRVIFYSEKNGTQQTVGGGYGNVVNLKPGESQQITVVCTPVQNYTDATQYVALPDYVWTDKDAVRATPAAGPTNQTTPGPAAPTP